MHTVSGSISLAVRRSFHRSLTVLFAIGHRLVFSLGGWSPQIQPGFLVSRPTRVPDLSGTSDFAYGTLTLYGPPFQARSAILSLRSCRVPQPRNVARRHGLGSSPFARRYLGNLWFDFSSSGYLDVSVPRVRLSNRDDGIVPAGFPHSEISGSKLACSSPKLIAACHVLHRRPVPRHPPRALTRLTGSHLACLEESAPGLTRYNQFQKPENTVRTSRRSTFGALSPTSPAPGEQRRNTRGMRRAPGSCLSKSATLQRLRLEGTVEPHMLIPDRRGVNASGHSHRQRRPRLRDALRCRRCRGKPRRRKPGR